MYKRAVVEAKEGWPRRAAPTITPVEMLIADRRKSRRESLSIVTRFFVIDFARKSKALTCWSQGLVFFSVCFLAGFTCHHDQSGYVSRASLRCLCLVNVHDRRFESRVP